jgi:hypothetical protein
MEKCIGCELCAGVCPARCIYVRGADNPPDARCRRGSATASSTRSTSCAASTATCASRPARPRPSPSRSCSSGPLSTGRTPSTPRRSCSSTTRVGPRSCRGRTGTRATTATPRPGCGPPARRIGGHGRQAAVVGRARLRGAAGPEGQSDPDFGRLPGRHRPVASRDGLGALRGIGVDGPAPPARRDPAEPAAEGGRPDARRRGPGAGFHAGVRPTHRLGQRGQLLDSGWRTPRRGPCSSGRRGASSWPAPSA